jgi:hypothetical protein
MEKPTFTRVNLSDVKVIMAIMYISVVDLLCEVSMGWILVLKFLLSGARGHLWPCLIMLGIKCCRFLKTHLRWCLPGTKSLQARLLRDRGA